MAIGERCRRIHDPGARRLKGHKGVITLQRLLLSEALHHGSPDRPRVLNSVEVGQRIRVGILPPGCASLGNVVCPKCVGISAHHLGDARVALPEETSEDLGIALVKQRVGSGSVPARVDIAAPGRHEADENAVLGSPIYNPVYEGEVALVRLCHVLIVDGQVSIEVGDAGDIVLGQQHGLDHVEALGSTVRKVEVDIGAVELVEELPIGVSDPKEGLVGLGPV